MDECPQDPTTCHCAMHHPGLAVHAKNSAAYQAALDRLQPTTLRVVTAGPRDTPPCDGTFTCDCSACRTQRAILQNTPRPRIAQPWDPRPSRKAA